MYTERYGEERGYKINKEELLQQGETVRDTFYRDSQRLPAGEEGRLLGFSSESHMCIGLVVFLLLPGSALSLLDARRPAHVERGGRVLAGAAARVGGGRARRRADGDPGSEGRAAGRRRDARRAHSLTQRGGRLTVVQIEGACRPINQLLFFTSIESLRVVEIN